MLTYVIFFNTRTEEQLLTVFAEPSVSEVKLTVRSRLYVGYPHIKGKYLDAGATSIAFHNEQGVPFIFSAKEELQLAGIHFKDGAFYLILIAVYMPERGFLAYKNDNREFLEISLSKLPPEIAFANVGDKGKVAKSFFGIDPLPNELPQGFDETATAWLWSQLVTGESVLSQGLNKHEVEKFWVKWATSISKLFE